ncbi:hypothetical protein VNO78_12244 [Psophocarpus tetragonolobus]|uniref:Uncharacterized protein n=1 Tax=Psophocarpus tetragonolobus TaxID=3891 RepID=A0AAN9SQE7_PSOTE
MLMVRLHELISQIYCFALESCFCLIGLTQGLASICSHCCDDACCCCYVVIDVGNRWMVNPEVFVGISSYLVKVRAIGKDFDIGYLSFASLFYEVEFVAMMKGLEVMAGKWVRIVGSMVREGVK